jgi:hypothetical protein
MMISELSMRWRQIGSLATTALVAFVLTCTLLSQLCMAERVDLFGGGAWCPCKSSAGSVNVAGCDTHDTLLYKSQSDNDNRLFQMWCIDSSHFGLRFVKKNAEGEIISEKWVGLCPYGGGRNRANGYDQAFAYRIPVEGGGFQWATSGYRSRDDSRSGDTLDDDRDRKLDSVNFVFFVDICELYGFHFDDNVETNEHIWGCSDIPGDPADTEDGPIDLLDLLPAGGNLGRSMIAGGCPGPLETQYGGIWSVPTTDWWSLLVLLGLLILSGIYVIYQRRKGVAGA